MSPLLDLEQITRLADHVRQPPRVRTLRVRWSAYTRFRAPRVGLPASRVAPASSPFQRMADALAAQPSATWSLLDLYEAGQCDLPTGRLCLERLVREGLLEHHCGELWRAADRRMGARSWW